MAEEIAKNVYKIKGDGNIYLILNESPTLIDTSDKVDSLHIAEEIKKLIPLEQIETILLTHLHYDHAGNMDLFPNAKVYADKTEIENFKNSPRDFFFYFLSNDSIKILEEKARALPKEIAGLKVLNVPGHTQGSVAFVDDKNKIVFSGDTVFNHGVGRQDLPTSNPDVMFESVEKIKELVKQGYKLMPGHDY